MKYYNRIIGIMEEKIKNFSKKISNGVKGKKKRDFIFDMIYGLMASSSCHLSEIARSLNEDISLRALVKRLCRNLDEFNNGKEIVSSYEDIENKTIFENYEKEIKGKIDEDTVFCFDPGLFSAQEEKFKSVNDEYLKAIEYLGKKYDKKGIFALDRGFDDKKYFEKFVSLELDFVIRMKKNRDIANADSGIVENIKKKAKIFQMIQ